MKTSSWGISLRHIPDISDVRLEMICPDLIVTVNDLNDSKPLFEKRTTSKLVLVHLDDDLFQKLSGNLSLENGCRIYINQRASPNPHNDFSRTHLFYSFALKMRSTL